MFDPSRIISKRPLWKHQITAMQFVHKQPRGAMLAMPMGTGKSAVAIALIQNSNARNVLILAPKSVVDVWPDQFMEHWASKRHFVLGVLNNGSVAERTERAEEVLDDPARLRILIINYEAAWRQPFRNLAVTTPWDLIIADESHRMKKAGGKIGLFMTRVGQYAGFRLALTGTPMPHSPLDLYAQFRFLDSNIFGTRIQDFKAAYAHIGGPTGQQIIGWHHLDDLKERMGRRAFSVPVSVLDLPPAVDVERITALEPLARTQYKELEKEFITEVQGKTITAANAGVKLMRLHEMAGGWASVDKSERVDPKKREYVRISTAKEELFADVLEDLQGEPLVVFTRFHNDLDVIRKVAKKVGLSYAEMSGRRNDVKAWQDGKFDLIGVQMQAGAEGNTYVRARYAIFYSMTISNGNYQQCRARLVRPGQEHSVTFIHLICRGTVDRYIYRRLARNEDVVRGVMSSLEEDYADVVAGSDAAGV